MCSRGDACRFSHDAAAVAAHAKARPGAGNTPLPSSGTPHGDGSVAKRLSGGTQVEASNGGSKGAEGGLKGVTANGHGHPQQQQQQQGVAVPRAVPQPRPGGYAAAAAAVGGPQGVVPTSPASAPQNPWQQAPAHAAARQPGVPTPGAYTNGGLGGGSSAGYGNGQQQGGGGPIAGQAYGGQHGSEGMLAPSYAHQLQAGLSNGGPSPGKGQQAPPPPQHQHQQQQQQQGVPDHGPAYGGMPPSYMLAAQQGQMMAPPPQQQQQQQPAYGASMLPYAPNGMPPFADMAALRRDLPPYGMPGGHALLPPPPAGAPYGDALAGGGGYPGAHAGMLPHMAGPPGAAAGYGYGAHGLGGGVPSYDMYVNPMALPNGGSPMRGAYADASHPGMAQQQQQQQQAGGFSPSQGFSTSPRPGAGLGGFSAGGYSLFADAAGGGAQAGARGSPGGAGGQPFGGLMF